MFIKFSSVGPQGLTNLYKKEPRIVLRNLRKLWPFYLKQFIPEMLLGGHLDYVKFILIGRSRTGSNLLRGSLMSHSRIVVFGDLFRKYRVDRPNDIYWGLPFYPQTQDAISLRQRDPIRFLETQVFRKFPTCVSAVGFKVLYPHAHPESWQPVLNYLRDQKTLKVIHIKRRNILKTHLSLKRVEHSKDKWVNLAGTPEDNGAIFLDYEECLQAFIHTRQWETEHDRLFEGHDKLEVVYEDLVSNYQAEMKRIQEFLGVKYETVKPLTYKQTRQPLSKAIANYAELKQRFANTPWEIFFED